MNRTMRCWVVVGLLGLLVGCAGGPTNPSFAVEPREAREKLRAMERSPTELERPVVVIGGWGDPLGMAPAGMARQLRRVIGDDRVIGVSMGGLTSIDACRDRVIREVDRRFPNDDPERTVEVDVIGFSMGGLVAEYASLPVTLGDDTDASGRRLNVRRMIYLAVPIRGAAWAEFPMPGQLGRAMRRDSDLLLALASVREPDSFEETIYYVRLNDGVVGEENTVPEGVTPWWVPNLPLQLAHAHAYKDPRIVADIARRLRGETPLVTYPPAPLPDDDDD
jgi:pimeloyl-ACP methyl ester carboxylesterase